MRRNRILALLVAFGLLAAACGGGGATTTAAPTTAATTAATTAPPEETTTAAAEIKTDIGVDVENKVITLGLLSDLTGPFGPLVSQIVDGHQVYWESVNNSGGIEGWTVKLEVRDTVYVVDNHVQFYNELKDKVVAFGHSTGSPHTVAIVPQLVEDGILAVPLTWYSGWTDPNLGSNLVHHGAPYCLEAMNVLEYVSASAGGTKVALVTLPGDYGLDSAAGAKLAIEALGLELVYDGSGLVLPGQDQKPIADAIVASGAEIVFATTNPQLFSEIYGQAIAQGYQAVWTGSAPSWSPAFITPESAIKDAIARDFWGSGFVQPWAAESEGMTELMATFAELRPDAPPANYYSEGYVEAMIMHAALAQAIANGDLTQAGVLAAAKSLENVDFKGLGPSETYVGEPNDQVQRQSMIFRPDPTFDDGSGIDVVQDFFASDTAANFTFNEACYKLEG
jgi:ABC-type branched-subunit amino acid transport system substrate-binding protein